MIEIAQYRRLSRSATRRRRQILVHRLTAGKAAGAHGTGGGMIDELVAFRRCFETAVSALMGPVDSVLVTVAGLVIGVESFVRPKRHPPNARSAVAGERYQGRGVKRPLAAVAGQPLWQFLLLTK